MSFKAEARHARALKLDDLDAAILKALRDDARLSFRDVAAKVGTSVPTVSARVKALEDIGLVKGYTLVLGATVRESGGATVADVACHQCKGPIHDEGHRRAFGGRTHVFCCKQCLATFGERFERAAGSA